MVTRKVTIYEVPNSYVTNGSTVTIQNTFTLTFNDDDPFLNATAGADSGTPQSLTSTAGTISSYRFFYNDTSLINGTSTTLKTFQMTIGGSTRSFIMSDSGKSITGAGTGSSLQLSSYTNYSSLAYTSIPCLAAGTHVSTARGQVEVDDLCPGDMVRTQDNGMQPVRWIGSVHLTYRDLLARPKLAPVLIAPGALPHGQPTRPLLVSPQHRILLEGWDLELHFGCEEALAPACSLVGRSGITSVLPDQGVTYFHILFDRHEIIFAEGLATESFFVGDTIHTGLDGETLAEIMDLFPQLAHQYGPLSQTARMVLRTQDVGALYSGAA